MNSCYFVRRKKETKENGVCVLINLIDKISCNQTRDLRLIIFDLMMNESLIFSSKKKTIWGSNLVYIIKTDWCLNIIIGAIIMKWTL